MYDGFPLGESMDLIDPVEYELDRFCLDSDKPACYVEEEGNPYPLCVGRGLDACKKCSLWADLQPDLDL